MKQNNNNNYYYICIIIIIKISGERMCTILVNRLED